MKIECWEDIENIRLTKNGNFRDIVKKKTYYYHKHCLQCGKEFFGNKDGEFCSRSCLSSNTHKDRIVSEETKKKMRESAKKKPPVSEETRKKMSESAKKKPPVSEETKEKLSKLNKGIKRSEETKKKISKYRKDKKHTDETKKKLRGENSVNWTGGYHKKDIPLYNTYAPQIEWCEELRRNKEDLNILEVKCFKCGEWFIPTLNSIHNRLQILKGNNNYRGEQHFYCSDKCRNSCSIYGKTPEQVMKADAVRAGRFPWMKLGRELQGQLREMVLERDEYQCIKCGTTENLKCHHILPVATHPLESADIDNCITLCKECHDKIHKEIDGCRPRDLRMEMC